ncbi:hypothetical protein DSM26151_22610 [Agromyces marinus]|nr:hypothetical protein DSM26151_22610 [Agromyces marinus]
MLGVLSSAPASGARSAIAAAGGADGALRWQTPLSDDAGAQADAATSVLDRFVASHGATWTRTVVTRPVDRHVGPDAEPADPVVLMANPAAPARSILVDGTWPDVPAAAGDAAAVGAVPGALHADAAAGAGVGPGDVLELDGIRWSSSEPGKPRTRAIPPGPVTR